jgi:alkylation response protein AidB-like acyl-CoA dehydrogenase
VDQDAFNMVLDAARRWFEREQPLRERIAGFAAGHQPAASAMAAINDMGWTALARPEATGGYGASVAQCFALIRLAGREARPEPLDLLLMLAGGPALPVDDVTRLAMADAGGGPGALRMSADNARVDGRSGVLYGGVQATHALLPVPMGEGRVRLACVALHASGATHQPVRLMDGRHALRLHLESVQVTPVGEGPQAEAIARLLLDRAAAGLVADAAGVFEAAFELTLDYLKQRRQFGVALASHQALQQRMADIFCDLQFLSALARRLALEMDAAPSGPWPTLPVAKSFVGRRALRALGQLIQVSGGIGMTEAYRLGHFYKRLHVASTLFGGAEHQLDRIDPRQTLLAT